MNKVCIKNGNLIRYIYTTLMYASWTRHLNNYLHYLNKILVIENNYHSTKYLSNSLKQYIIITNILLFI